MPATKFSDFHANALKGLIMKKKFIYLVLCFLLIHSSISAASTTDYECKDADKPGNVAIFTVRDSDDIIVRLKINAYGTLGSGFGHQSIDFECKDFCYYPDYSYARGYFLSADKSSALFMLGRNYEYEGACVKRQIDVYDKKFCHIDKEKKTAWSVEANGMVNYLDPLAGTPDPNTYLRVVETNETDFDVIKYDLSGNQLELVFHSQVQNLHVRQWMKHLYKKKNEFVYSIILKNGSYSTSHSVCSSI